MSHLRPLTHHRSDRDGIVAQCGTPLKRPPKQFVITPYGANIKLQITIPVGLWFISPMPNYGSELDRRYDRSRSRIAFRSRLFSSSNCLYSALISGSIHPNSHRRTRVICNRRDQQGSPWRLMPLYPDMNEEVHPDVPGIQYSLPDTAYSLSRPAVDCRSPGAVAPHGSDPYIRRWHI